MTTEDTYEYKIDTPVVEDLFEADTEELATAISTSSDSPFPKHRDKYNLASDVRVMYMKEAEMFGFTEGCVVVAVATEKFNRVIPEHWGIVLDTVSWPAENSGYFAPIKVGWLNGKVTYHYPEDLIAVQYAPDDQDLGLVMQGVQ